MTFVLFAIDYAIVCHNQDENTGLMNGGVMTLFAVAGGAAGMFLALCLFTKFRMNKHNIAWWFSAIVCLIVWTLIVLVWSGAIALNLDCLGGFNVPVLTGIGVYLLVMSVVTLCAFGADKRSAEMHGRRIPEAALLGLSLAGGTIGGIVGMQMFRHKTRKWYFRAGLPAFVALHIALLTLAHMSGLV